MRISFARISKNIRRITKKSDTVFDSIDLLYYHFHKTSLKRTGSSYINSLEWLKNKKATINPENNDNNCFQYAITIALNHQSIKKDAQRISKIKLFIDQYKWKETEFPAKLIKDCKNLNQIINQLLLTSYIYLIVLKIMLAYKSKYNHKREN